MRQFLFCVLFGVALAAPHVFESSIDPAMFEDLVNSTIEGLRPDIADPLKIDDFPISFADNSTLLTGTADLSNFEFTGLKDFEVTYLNLDLFALQLNFTLVLPVININTDYTGDLLLGQLVPLYGDGKANIHFVDTEITGSGQADLTNGLSIKNLVIKLFLGSSTFDIHGALDNEDFSTILSELLNDIVTSFVDNHQDVISTILSPIFEQIIDAILASTDTNTTTQPRFVINQKLKK